MRGLRQIVAVTVLNFRGLAKRSRASLVVVVGIACVVGVLLSMLSFATGLRRSIMAAGDPGRAIVLTSGAQDEYGQSLSRAAVATIMDAPGIARDADGKPIVSAEHLTDVPGRRQGDGLSSYIVLRGIGPKGLVLRPGFRLTAGRMFRPGQHELIAGAAAQAQYEGLAIGDKVALQTGVWTVVGIFTTGGDMIESQLLGEIETVLAGVKQDGFGSVIVRLESPGAFDRFKQALKANPMLDVDVERQSEFYARVSGRFTIYFAGTAYLLAGLMAAGALFGTLNIMYSAVSARAREIATLRALGFGGLPVALSVVSEALLLALAGALLGAGIAWLLFDGHRQSTGANVFQLLVTPGMVALGLSWALLIALLGGVFPAIRAARLPVATALRAG